MKDKEAWMWRQAKLWQFWLPQSGLAGGLVWGALLALLLIFFTGDALAQFAYECYRPNGSSFVSEKKCAEGLQWRVIQTDPYYTTPVKRVYERHTKGATVILRQHVSPHPKVVQGAVSQAPPAQVQQGYSNEELTRELNGRYKDYGGYKTGHTLTKGQGWYSWHK